MEYEININSLNIPCRLVYDDWYEHKNKLRSSNGHAGQLELDTSYYCKK